MSHLGSASLYTRVIHAVLFALLCLPLTSNVAHAQGNGVITPLPGLVNLTKSPAKERYAVFSPSGDIIAFTSNGLDVNGDHRIDNPTSTWYLYTMSAEGKGLKKCNIPGSVVGSIAWKQPNGDGIYAVVIENGTYKIYLYSIATETSTLIYEATDLAKREKYQLDYISITSTNTALYFDMLDASGKWNLYSMTPRAGAVPTKLTNTDIAVNQGNNRHPVVANFGNDLVFHSDRSGRRAIWRSAISGGNQVQWSTPPAGTEDYEPKVTADGGKIVFTSSRLTDSAEDFNYDPNIWAMNYAAEGPGNAPVVRFYPNFRETSTEKEASPHVNNTHTNELLFISDRDVTGADDIFFGYLVDSEAPLVPSPAVAEPKIAAPGDVVKVTVQVYDVATGVRNVWLQIKDPDPAALDVQGINHVITKSTTDIRTAINFDEMPFIDTYQLGYDLRDAVKTPPVAPKPDNITDVWYTEDVITKIPVEYGPLDPTTNTYLPLDQATSHPGYFAVSSMAYNWMYDTNLDGGMPNVTTGQGFPEVPTHWLNMYDDGTNGDDVANDGIYTCLWTTPPADIASDWVFDVITEDTVNTAKDSSENWHGNRRRYDNIGGCSTLQLFPGGKNILFVDDYIDGQRFLSQPFNQSISYYQAPAYLNALYYFDSTFIPERSYYEDTSPFLPTDTEFGGANIWRLLCRGPLPQDILESYLPRDVAQYDPTFDANGKITSITQTKVRHGEKVVVWVAPYPWSHLLNSTTSPNGTLSRSGSIIEEETLSMVRNAFINEGGRLFMIGSDLATGLTHDGTDSAAQDPQTSGYKFLTEVLGAQLVNKETFTSANVNANPNIFPFVNRYSCPPGLVAAPAVDNDSWTTSGGWYGASLSHPRWDPVMYGAGHSTSQCGAGYWSARHGAGAGIDYRHNENPDGRNLVAMDLSHLHNVLVPNNNPSRTPYSYYSYYPEDFIYTLTWDQLSLADQSVAPGAARAFVLFDTDNTAKPPAPAVATTPIVGVSNDLSAYASRVVFWSFGYEHLSYAYRNRPARDSIEWLLDGSISGTVMQMNGGKAISNAVVVATQGSRKIAATTDTRGYYAISGLRPAMSVLIEVYANGYYGQKVEGSSVVGGRTVGGNDFLLYRDINTCTVWGYVKRSNKPVVGAVIATSPVTIPVVTDMEGRYEISNIAPRDYVVTATHPNGTTISSDKFTLNNGDNKQVDLEFGVPAPDGLIKLSTDDTYSGDNIYNEIQAQTISTEADSNEEVVYHVQIQNDSKAADRLRITAPVGGAGWTVEYWYTDPTGVTPDQNVTAQITGTLGWDVDVAANATVNLNVIVKPDVTVPGGAEKEIAIVATSMNDPAFSDTVIGKVSKTLLTSVTLTADPVSPVLRGTAIKLTATAVGGGAVEYRFLLRYKDNDGNWRWGDDIREYGIEPSCTWTPTLKNTYQVVVYVRELVSGKQYDKVGMLAYTILDPLTSVALTDSPAGITPVSTPVLLTATPTGGAFVEYEFTVNDGTTSKIIKPYSQQNSVIWKPTKVANYSVTVRAREIGTTVEYPSTPIHHQVTATLSAVSVTADIMPPRMINTPISLQATPTGGANVEYKFRIGYLQGGAWVWETIRDYDTSATCPWVPMEIHDYTIVVHAREIGSTKPYDVYGSMKFAISGGLSAVTLTTSPLSPQQVGKDISLSVSRADGGNVEYLFLAKKNGEADLTQLSPNYSQTSNFNWKPLQPGNYYIEVWAREVKPGVRPIDEYDQKDDITNYTILPIVNDVSIASAPLSPALVNSTVIFTANAVTDPISAEPVEYWFKVRKNINGVLEEVGSRLYALTNTYSWTPTSAGTYSIIVYARVNQSTKLYEAYRTMTYIVRDPLSGVKLSGSPEICEAVNLPITIKAIPNGGLHVEYKFVELSTNTEGVPLTKVLQDYNQASTLRWTPTATGTYSVKVYAREGSVGEGAYTDALNYTINPTLTGVRLDVNPVSPYQINKPITLTATPTGGGNLEYQFQVKPSQGIWLVLQDYSSESTCKWTPTVAGVYLLRVFVRERNNKALYKTASCSYITRTPLSGIDLVVSARSPQPMNSSENILLTANVTGGAKVQYQFLVNDGVQTVILQDYSSTNTCVWKPSKAGLYSIIANVKEAESIAQADFTDMISSFVITESLTGLELSAEPQSPQVLNTLVTFTAVPVGGANLEYKFRIGYNLNGKISWLVDTAYSASNTYTWTSAASNLYTVTALAREKGNTSAYDKYTSIKFQVTETLKGVNLSVDSASPRPINSERTLTAKPIGGANVLYTFKSILGGVETLIARDSRANTCTWLPTTVGEYLLSVEAHETGTATIVSDQIASYTILPELSRVTLTVDKFSPRPVNTQITLTATPTGGANVVYLFEVSDGSTTTQLNGEFKAANTMSWTPTTPGTYTITVKAKEVDGSTVITSQLPYIIKPLLSGVHLATSLSSPRTVNRTIQLSASTTGGANVSYVFTVDGKQIPSNGNSCSWTPSTAKSYVLSVTATDSDGTVKTASMTFEILAPLSRLTLQASPVSPRIVNTPITLNASVTGGANVRYKFIVGYRIENIWNWVTLQDYSARNSCMWTPDVPRDYTLKVFAREDENTAEYEECSQIDFTISPVLSAVTITANPVSPQPANSKIVLTAWPTGGANVTYRYDITGPEPRMSGGYNTSNQFEWVPTISGEYTITVSAFEKEGVRTSSQTASVKYTVTSPLTRVNIAASLPSPQVVNSPITLTATADGGAKVEYLFKSGYQVNNVWQWTTIRDYSTAASCTWVPTEARYLSVVVFAREVGSSEKPLMGSLSYRLTPPLTSVAITTTPASPQLANKAISIKANPAGGANVEYQFFVNDGSGDLQLSGMSTTDTCTWIPSSAGSYTLKVKAQEKNGSSTVNGTLSYTIMDPISKVTLTTDPNGRQLAHKPITLTATAIGGANIEYQFVVRQGTETTIRSFDTANTCTWTPAYAGEYTLVVTAREKNTQQTVTAQALYTIVPSLSAVSLEPSLISPAPLGTSIVLTAQSTGGADVRYEFQVKANTVWQTIQSYSTSRTVYWIPQIIGPYQVRVNAREDGTASPVVTSSILNYEVVSRIDTLSLEVLKNSAPVVGSWITLKAAAITAPNSTELVEYNFIVSKEGNEVTSGYRTSNTFSWNPSAPGNYTLTVNAHVVGCSRATDKTTSISYEIKPALSGVQLTTNVVTPQVYKRTVVLTAQPNGGAKVQYQFRVSDNMGNLVQSSSYSTTNTWNWMLDTIGTFTLEVSAKEMYTTQEYKTTQSFTVIGKVITVQLSADKTSLPVNTPITFTATPSTSPQVGVVVEYQFSCRTGDGAWTILHGGEYIREKSYTWTPSKPGSYTVYVQARAVGSTSDVEMNQMSVNVTAN